MRALLAAAACVAGCAVLEDNATHLAFDVEKAAAELRASNDTTKVVQYNPIGRRDQPYAIDITASRRAVRVDAFGNIDAPGGSALKVTGDHPGGTGYHERFVYVPRALHIAKNGGPTEVVLSKVDGRVDIVELR